MRLLEINNAEDEVTLSLFGTGGYLSVSSISGSTAADTKMGFKTLLEVDSSNFVPMYILPDGEETTSASSATAEKKKKTSTSDSTSYTKGSSSR